MDIYRKATLLGLFLLAGGLVACPGGEGSEGGEGELPELHAFGSFDYDNSDPGMGWDMEEAGNNPLHPVMVGDELSYRPESGSNVSLNYNQLYFYPVEVVGENGEVEVEWVLADPPHVVNYDTPGRRNFGTATSIATVRLGITEEARLVFWCLFDTENQEFPYTEIRFGDSREVLIINDNLDDEDRGSAVYQTRLGSHGVQISPEGECSRRGEWHTHSIILLPEWGDVKVQFKFDTRDHLVNDGMGWFLDDIRLEGRKLPGAGDIRAIR